MNARHKIQGILDVVAERLGVKADDRISVDVLRIGVDLGDFESVKNVVTVVIESVVSGDHVRHHGFSKTSWTRQADVSVIGLAPCVEMSEYIAFIDENSGFKVLTEYRFRGIEIHTHGKPPL